MKCKFCDSCKKGYFKSKPNSYVCIGVKEPFIISNIEQECTEYKDNKIIYEKIKAINNYNLKELYLTIENGCASDITLNDINKVVEHIYFLFDERENLYEENYNLRNENELLKDIIIEKEKELYNR